MKDNKGEERQIVLSKAKLSGFLKGPNKLSWPDRWKEKIFYADEILVKCPSKYKQEEITLRKSS